MSDLAIRLDQVSKSFEEGRRRRGVLREVSVSIPAGQFVVLLGRSGSGKSTFLNLVSGIDLPDEGRVELRGLELNALGDAERTRLRREHVGFIFQTFNLIPTLTVLENIRLRPELNRVSPREAIERGRALLDSVELSDRADTFPDRLSGGEQQRVAIAAALAHDPGLILADEPTGNLDQETGERVVTLLDDLVRREGKTLVMVTHSREMIGVADRVLTIVDGGLEELEDRP